VVGILGITVDELDAPLLGEGQLDLLTSGSAQFGLALLHRFDGLLDFGLGDALLLGDDLASDSGEGDGLVDASLDGLGVGHLDGNINGRDNRYIVSSFLGNFFAVFSVSTVSTISVMSVVSVSLMSRLADGDHLDLSFFPEGNLNSLGSGVFVLLLVSVGTDFLRNLLNGFSADGASDSVTHFFVNNALDGQVNIFASGHNGGSTDLSFFSHILNSAVVFGLLITIPMSMMAIGGSMVVGWLVMVDRGWFVVFGFRFVCGCGFRGVSGCRFRFVSGGRSRLV